MPKYRVRRHPVTQPLNESYRFIPLTRGQNAIVDIEDFEWLSRWNWRAERQGNTYYAATDTPSVYMHRVLSKTPNDIDHKNGNGLDNRKNNLRPCTHAENMHNCRKASNNTSGYKGVTWDKSRNKWQAKSKHGGKIVMFGRFSSAEEAARAYDAGVKILFGEFAHLNFNE